MIVSSITELIGNTPMLKLPTSLHGLKHIDLYLKLELFNPWGSVKDRTAWGMLQPHLDELGSKIVLESSSGNTIKALQLIASIHGSKAKTITNRIKASEVKDILILLGTTIQELPGKSDCYDPNDLNDPKMHIEQELVQHPDSYIYTDQYFNDFNRKIHFDTTGKEILDDLDSVDFLVGSLGTAGSSLGVSQRLKKVNADLEIIGVVGEQDDYIPGIRNQDEVLEVGLYQQDIYNEIVSVSSNNALETMRQLIQTTGVLAGPTTGATIHGGIEYLATIDKTLTSRKSAVLIACDRVEWYMSYIKERKPYWFDSGQIDTWQDKVTINKHVEIAVDQAERWIAEHNPMIVDMRQPISFRTMHIENSINLPYDQLNSTLNTTNPFCTNQKILFVCPVGQRSTLVASHLLQQGLSAFSLKGGLQAWNDGKLPLDRETLNQ